MTTAVPPRDVLSSLDAATLAAAVESCRSWRQVLLTLGLSPNRHARRLRDRCDEWGIDYSHFRYHVFTDEQLVEVLGSAATWAEALSRLGYAADSGSARATIRKHARRLGLPAPVFAIGPVAAGGSLALTPLRSQLRNAGTMLIATTCILAGHRISWPLEPAPYDLLVDTGAEQLRVQVKTCTRRIAGSWNCAVTRSEYAGVAGGKRRAWYSADEIDVFAIIDGDGHIYWIPIEDVIGQASLSLRRYGAYRVATYGDLYDAAVPEEGPAPDVGTSSSMSG